MFENKGFALYPPALGRFGGGQNSSQNIDENSRKAYKCERSRMFFESKGVKNGCRGTI
jgi:hypothetical protein